MAKLFPPYIEGTLPAFYQNSDGTATIAVPFTMNRGVSFQQINGFMMKIKSIQSSTYLYSTKDINYTTNTMNNNYAYFELPEALDSEKEKTLSETIQSGQTTLNSIENKIEKIETISQLYDDLINLPNREERINEIEKNIPFYTNRIAEIKHYYGVTDSTQNKEIAALEAAKRAKIAELGTEGAYYDIQNINIAKNFYKVVNELNTELAKLTASNDVTINDGILNSVKGLVNNDYLTLINSKKDNNSKREVSDYYSENSINTNLQNILYKEENNDLAILNILKSETTQSITDAQAELAQFTTSDLKPGLYYKVQLAYIDKNNDIGQYSTVGIVKYTTKPKVGIEGLSSSSINTTWHNYVGYYTQQVNNIIGDTTERAYSYQFDFYDEDHNLIESSGTLLHNSSNDANNYYSSDEYYFSRSFDIEQIYYVQYTVTTQNGLVLSTPEYAVMEKYSKALALDATLEATLNYDNGYVDIWLQGNKNGNGYEENASGSYIFARATKEEDDKYTVWEKIFDFTLMNEKPTQRLWRDYTIEQGKTYKYSLQQFNKFGVFSSRLSSNEVFADFEDMFLADGKRQLKIRFNPKVSSFKNDILEQKIDTIGSKYPFIFRNGNVYYKEFPISGLISQLMDEEELFFNWDTPKSSSRQDTAWFDKNNQKFIYGYTQDINVNSPEREPLFRENDKTINLKTNLTSNNIYDERQFKLEVLQWLNNGEPKIFRSPTEGNYIVRLLNVSLSPNDTLGRMLHTFQCTAYEVDDFKYSTLQTYNFLQNSRIENKPLMWETQTFFKNEDGTVVFLHPKISVGITSFKLEECQPGEIFFFKPKDGNEEKIVIGATGQYIMSYPTELDYFKVPDETNSYGQITYSFYGEPYNDFDDITKIEVKDILCQEFIGPDVNNYNILSKITNFEYDGQSYKNSKITLNKIYYLKIYPYYDLNKELSSNLINNNLDKRAVEIKYSTDDSRFLSVQDRAYFIPIRNLSVDEIPDQINIYPETKIEIGYQIIEETFNGETELKSYRDYQNALEAYNNIISNIAAKEKDELIQEEIENKETDILICLDNIKITRNKYYYDVMKMREAQKVAQEEKEKVINEIQGG